MMVVSLPVLLVCGFSSAQDNATASPDTGPFLKLCSHGDPPPCIDKPPVVTRVQSPTYSKEGREAEIQGTVVLEAVIGIDGLPSHIRVVRPLGHGLDEEAVKALNKWKFKPARSAGKPVPFKANIEMTFRYH